MRNIVSAATAAFFVVVLFIAGCKDGILEPERFGTIQGRVLDFHTNQPIGGALVTTSPPTGAITTGADGTFSFEDVLTGNYTITGNKSGYDPNTVTVAVQSDRTTQATLFLSEQDEEPEDTTNRSIAVDVLAFDNVTRNDSTYVVTNYRVRNTGNVPVAAYEVYFRIETTGSTYQVEQQGQNLGIGQIDISDFEKLIFRDQATAVVVDTFSVQAE